MTKFRKRPAQRFIALLVQPGDDFKPQGWQDIPKSYRVVDYVGPKQFRGRADAWRFMENKTVLDQLAETDNTNPHRPAPLWAIVIE